MKRRIVHWLMGQQWLCSKRFHGLPGLPFCLYAWALEECAVNHPEEWEEVDVKVAKPLKVTRPARVDGMNVYVNDGSTISVSAGATRITKATVTKCAG